MKGTLKIIFLTSLVIAVMVAIITLLRLQSVSKPTEERVDELVNYYANNIAISTIATTNGLNNENLLVNNVKSQGKINPVKIKGIDAYSKLSIVKDEKGSTFTVRIKAPKENFSIKVIYPVKVQESGNIEIGLDYCIIKMNSLTFVKTLTNFGLSFVISFIVCLVFISVKKGKDIQD